VTEESGLIKPGLSAFCSHRSMQRRNSFWLAGRHCHKGLPNFWDRMEQDGIIPWKYVYL